MDNQTSNKTAKNNRYEFILKLGEGGMGAVYKVVDRLTGMLVALKEIKVDEIPLQIDSQTLSSDKVALINEFKILSSLRHPNIVSVIDYGFEVNQPFFTMELLDSPQTITTFTKGKQKSIKVQLLVQLLQALSYLHHRKIIHRDLKPANIIIDHTDILKVLDFGIALPVDYSDQTSNSMTGTLAYMAPEILYGNPVSIASDLYAVGLISYEVFTEEYPF